MTLRLSLIIDGDSRGAREAAQQASAAVKEMGSAASSNIAPLDRVSVATGKLAGSHAGLSTQAMALSHSMRSSVEQLILGIPPTQILAQQINHLSYAASGQGGLSGAFKEMTGALIRFVSPTTLVVGGLAAIAAGTYLVGQSIAETEKAFGALSERTNLTVQSLHALESAATFKGIDTADFVKGMQQFSALTDEAQHGLGSLASIFRANKVTVGGLNENLLHSADLIRNASSEAERYRLIQQLGLPATREWVQFLSQGSDGLRQAAQGAVQFGGAADEHMIRKAREFDEVWDTGWKNFATYAKRSFVDAKGWMEELARLANRWGQDLHPHMLGLRLSNAFADTGDYSSPALKTALEKRAARLRNGSATINPDTQQKDMAVELQRIGVLGRLASIQDAVRRSEIDIQKARLAGATITEDEERRIRSFAESEALGTYAIRQQVDATRIEMQIVGLGVGATAAFRAEQERLADFRLRGIALTKEQAAAIRTEAQALGAVTRAAAERRLRSDIGFEGKQIGRSSDEQQIANRLRGIYGDDYQSHMNDAIAGQMRLNQQLQFTHDIGQEAFKGFLSDLRQGKSLGEAFGNSMTGMLGRVEDKLAEMAFNGLWNAAFGGLTGGLAGGGFNIFKLFGFAGGGQMGAERWAVVGEEGPELVKTHAGGGVTVYSNDQSKRLLASGRLPGFADGGGFDRFGRTLAPPFAPSPRETMQQPAGRDQQVVYREGDHYTVHAPGASAEAMAVAFREIRALKRQQAKLPETLPAVWRKRPGISR